MRFTALLLQLIALCSVTLVSASQTATAPARTSPVVVGEMAPDFNLTGYEDHKVTLSAARGKSPVVLVFYRGYW